MAAHAENSMDSFREFDRIILSRDSNNLTDLIGE